jgi:hypothetical protein
MSATNRGAQRQPDDFYVTPAWATEAICRRVGWFGRAVDLGCGDGAIGKVAARYASSMHGVELDDDRATAAAMSGAYEHITTGDFLLTSYPHPAYDFAIGNPPYSLAMSFIERGLLWADEVCFLLRLNFLGSQKRAEFLRAHPCDVFVLPRRPSFTGKGTDATEYAWFIFGPDRERRWELLETPKK